MNKVKVAIVTAAVLAVIAAGLYEAVRWGVERVYVDSEHALVVINKFGDDLPADQVVVPADANHFKGVEQEVRGPGRYFLNPIEYDYRVVPLVTISAGDPGKWAWDADGHLKDPSTAPQVGVVSLKQGRTPVAGTEVVPAGYRGIQERVLTPGTYKLNPYLYDVKVEPAVVVPPGSVGVVTRLIGKVEPTVANATTEPTRVVTDAADRGVQAAVLQPGIYYVNPRVRKVTVMPVGYDQMTFEHGSGTTIAYTSSDGYHIESELTVVWGRDPADTPNILANIGTTDQVEQYVVGPAVKAACQNEGGKFTAKALMQGETRSKFQDDLQDALKRDTQGRSVHILLALVRTVDIKDGRGADQTRGLLATIQQANIETERELTNVQKTKTATVAADLQTSLRQVDVARETVASETNVKVAQTLADGQKRAAEIAAEQELAVATVQQQVAVLDAQRTQILGKANADVARMRQDAEAQGQKLLVDAFGTPEAYNLYTFAREFNPTEVRLIFAGPGTFWTDLKGFQDVGAAANVQRKAEAGR